MFSFLFITARKMYCSGVIFYNKIIFDSASCFLITLNPLLSGLDRAGICSNNEKVRITQMYLYNANKMK